MINFYKLLRLQQWLKNILIFFPLFLSFEGFNSENYFQLLLGFVIFSLACSSNYILNDIFDLEDDLKHPVNKNRAIPSGLISLNLSKIIFLLLFLISTISAYLFNLNFFILVLCYLFTALIYTLFLKKFPIIDLVVLSSFYIFRILIGISIVGIEYYSHWLIIFFFPFFLNLAIIKRLAEVKNRADINDSKNRPYVKSDFSRLRLGYFFSLTITSLCFFMYGIREESIDPNLVFLLLSCFSIFLWNFYIYRKMLNNVDYFDPFSASIFDKRSILLGALFISFVSLSNIL